MVVVHEGRGLHERLRRQQPRPLRTGHRRAGRAGEETGRAFRFSAAPATIPRRASVRAAAARVEASWRGLLLLRRLDADEAVGVFKAVAAGSPTMRLFGPDGVADSAFDEHRSGAGQAGVHHQPDAGAEAYRRAGSGSSRTSRPVRPRSGALRDLWLRGDERRPQLRSGTPMARVPTRKGVGPSMRSSARGGAGRCWARTTWIATATRRCPTTVATSAAAPTRLVFDRHAEARSDVETTTRAPDARVSIDAALSRWRVVRSRPLLARNAHRFGVRVSRCRRSSDRAVDPRSSAVGSTYGGARTG